MLRFPSTGIHSGVYSNYNTVFAPKKRLGQYANGADRINSPSHLTIRI